MLYLERVDPQLELGQREGGGEEEEGCKKILEDREREEVRW